MLSLDVVWVHIDVRGRCVGVYVYKPYHTLSPCDQRDSPINGDN